MSDVFNLDREQNLKARIDPTGRKWEVHSQRGSCLFHARPNPDREDAVIPALFYGEWTKPELLLEKIDLFLVRAWDDSDRKAAEARRTKEAAAENAEEAAKLAKLKAAVEAENAEIASKSEAKRIAVQTAKE